MTQSAFSSFPRLGRGFHWLSLAPFLLLVGMMMSSTGCGSTVSAAPSPAKAPGSANPSKTITAIAVSPASATLAVGAKQQFAVTATYSDNSTADVTAAVSWTSSASSIVTVSPSGLTTGIAAGSATLTAALNGLSGSVQITVPTPVIVKTIKSIAVSPASAILAVGAKQQFAAMATYSDGSTADVTDTANWTSSNSAVVTINATGTATGIAAGSATLTAASNGLSGSAQITVPAPGVIKTVTSIAVSPSGPGIFVGATQQFTATATYSDGSTRDVTTTVNWTSSTPAVATISATGVATAVTAGSATIAAGSNGASGTAVLSVTVKTVTALAISPSSANVAMGATQQFTATATYKDGSTADVTSTATWTAGNAAVAAVNSTGLATPDASGSTSITASLNGVTANAPLLVAIAPGTGVNISTWQSDAQRSGLNAGEKSLAPSNVGPQTFGKLFSYQMDGYEYGEPLLISNVTINGAAHNVVYAATENDSVYAFDADSHSVPLWQVSLLQAGETPLTNGPVQPYLGITSTPVIDAASKTLYVVSTQKTSGASTFRLNALDITTGAQKFGGPVTLQATVPGTNVDSINGMVSLTTACVQRAALLLANGTVYIGFGGCHSGWLLAYDAATLAQTGVFNASPNLNGEGAYASAGGIWMGGGGPAADASGSVYAVTGNGPWDKMTAWADSALRFDAQLHLKDSFTPDDYAFMNCDDADLGAGGLLLIPGTSQALIGGKTGKLYLLNTSNLGQEQAGDAGAVQTLFFEGDLSAPYSQGCGPDASGTHTASISSYEVFGTAAYFNGSVYLGVTPTAQNVPGGIRQFTLSSGGLVPNQETTPSILEGSYGTTPFITANGAQHGILWMLDHGQPLQDSSGTPTAAILRAYDAGDLTHELYSSATNSGDTLGFGIKFSSPIAANGKVYVSTGHDPVMAGAQGELDVYGLK